MILFFIVVQKCTLYKYENSLKCIRFAKMTKKKHVELKAKKTGL